eukprot:GDKH01023082.1.p1 GENE.GDKH01023082.1~~GDKH01023082.1.p1  ORF type:complete len:56 (+),score=0.07 GDKH01023082.1:372-539(+)
MFAFSSTNTPLILKEQQLFSITLHFYYDVFLAACYFDSHHFRYPSTRSVESVYGY